LITTPKNGWFAGIFDADGTVTINFHKGSVPQITISVTQKYREIPEIYQRVLGGSLYYDKAQNGYYKWAVQSKTNVLYIIEYFKNFPCRSSRRSKLFLIPHVYKAIEQRAYHPDNIFLYKKWQELMEKWQAL
jgi:ubiquinol-cytochrome c reductase cytochrome b subunit